MSLKDAILAAKDMPLQAVAVSEWDQIVYLRTMSGTERDQWELVAFADGRATPDHFRAKLLVRCITDESGQRVFADDEAPLLAGKSSTVLVKLYDIAAPLNGIGKKEEDELAKN